MLEKIEYKRATMEDMKELVRTRIIVLRAANKLSDDADMSLVEQETYAYYKRALETGEHIAYLVYDSISHIGFVSKSCEGTGYFTDCLRGNGYGTTIV